MTSFVDGMILIQTTTYKILSYIGGVGYFFILLYFYIEHSTFVDELKYAITWSITENRFVEAF